MNLTPLHNACDGGHLAVVQYLVEKGADPNTRGGVSFVYYSTTIIITIITAIDTITSFLLRLLWMLLEEKDMAML